MRTLLLTGPPGAGKTTVLTALMNLLEADDAPYAAVEVEALALVHPWPDDDVAFEHLELLARSFQRRGSPLLLVSATVEDGEYLRRVRAALPTGDVVLVRLEAPVEVLRERIAEREPPDWVGLPRLLEDAGTMATAIAALPGVDLVLGTDGADPRLLAVAIRGALHPDGA